MPEGMSHLSVLRVVVRNGLSRDLASLLVRDLRTVTEHLSAAGGAGRSGTAADAGQQVRAGFHH
jgi:glutamate decarboxylase